MFGTTVNACASTQSLQGKKPQSIPLKPPVHPFCSALD